MRNDSPSGLGLRLENISRIFDDQTGLNPVTLTIQPGEFVSVLGPSGCGKSTLLRCIAGLEMPDTGRMHFGNREVFNATTGTQIPVNRRNLSMVFQDLALWPHMTVAQNIEFPLTTSKTKVSAATRASLVRDAMTKVGISDKADHRPNQLSGGQQQRVAIARAIVANPQVLLMDEPLSALDVSLRDQIRAEITTLTKELGLTVVYVTHDQSEALTMSDRIIVMHEGHVRQFATPVEIYEDPADDFVAHFVGTMNVLPNGTEVRPERVALDPEGPLLATVTHVNYLGGHYDVHCRVDNVDQPWLVQSAQPINPGERVRLRVLPTPQDNTVTHTAEKKIHVF